VPKEVPITRRVLIEITRTLLAEGWELMRRSEIAADVRRYGLEHHREQPRNIGFRRSDGKGHAVKLWLSCDYDLAVEYKREVPLLLDLPVSFPLGVGMGWALIVNSNGRAMYFATPRNRTQNFQENFLWNARITWKRVENWPTCEKCGAEMEIVETANHANFWACYRIRDHADGVYTRKSWNFCLTQEERKIKDREYRKRAKGRKERKVAAAEQGKPVPRKAHDVRIPWNRKVVAGQ
jgi:hypothetical protein